VGARPLLASAKRSRIVLLADSGKQDLEIAAELGISNQKAARWRRRSAKCGAFSAAWRSTRTSQPFLSSHDSHEIRSLSDEISVIARGRLVYTGATRDLGADLDAFEECLIHLLAHRE
jgi:hypothetical protein